jgi:hypothetical protein
LREALKIVGSFTSIPATPGGGDGGVKRALYINLDPFKRTNLVGCCVGMAKCLRRENDMEMVGCLFIAPPSLLSPPVAGSCMVRGSEYPAPMRSLFG